MEKDKVPFNALNYLTAECNYGGKVTDERDRRLINSLLENSFNSRVLSDLKYDFT